MTELSEEGGVRMELPGYDVWKLMEPSDVVDCDECGGPVRGVGSLCDSCIREMKADEKFSAMREGA